MIHFTLLVNNDEGFKSVGLRKGSSLANGIVSYIIANSRSKSLTQVF